MSVILCEVCLSVILRQVCLSVILGQVCQSVILGQVCLSVILVQVCPSVILVHVCLSVIPGTELHGKNLVASRASELKKLLALTKIWWPSIMHRNALLDVLYLSEQKQL